MKTLFILLTAALLIPALSEPGPCQDVLQPEYRTLMDIEWVMRSRLNIHESYWLVEPSVNRIVGTATWNNFQRRFTLFDKSGKYSGFMQATLLVRPPSELHKEYLLYDENNEYRGVYIRELGGGFLPPGRQSPVGVPSREPARGSAGSELGGELTPYRIGSVALPLPEMKIQFFPWNVEEVLDEMRLPGGMAP
jgi:hypothetical protein